MKIFFCFFFCGLPFFNGCISILLLIFLFGLETVLFFLFYFYLDYDGGRFFVLLFLYY